MRARLLVALFLLAAACGDDDDGDDGETCNLDTGPSTISGDVDVTYTASVTGDGTISQIRFSEEAGFTTVNNPTLPFSLATALPTVNAEIEATGTVSDGSITIGYQASNAGGPEQDSASCSED